MTDIKLNYDKGYFDFNIVSGDFEQTDDLSTAILVSLGCDSRASESEVTQIEYRRGWAGNLVWNLDGLEMGSKLWLLSQARLTIQTLERAKDYAQNALLWLLTENYATNIVVDVERVNEEKIRIIINVFVNNDLEIQSEYTIRLPDVSSERINAILNLDRLLETGDVRLLEDGSHRLLEK